MKPDGTAKSTTKIASSTNGGPVLSTYDEFGSSITSLGDLDGDGVRDLAVGASLTTQEVIIVGQSMCC